MLTVTEQREIIIDRICAAMNRAINNAKFSRKLKLYDHAKAYYYEAYGYKKSIAVIKLLQGEPNELKFNMFPELYRTEIK